MNRSSAATALPSRVFVTLFLLAASLGLTALLSVAAILVALLVFDQTALVFAVVMAAARATLVAAALGAVTVSATLLIRRWPRR